MDGRESARSDDDSWLLVFCKGFCMGAADAVPGVSGGTIALIVGIYERLIDAIARVTPGRLRRALDALLGRRWRDLRAVFLEVDGVFLLTLGTGILAAVVVLTRVLAVALESYPTLTFGFFFGLIAASAVVLGRDVALDTRGRVAAAVVGFVVTFVASGFTEPLFGTSAGATVVAGASAVSAMILPGLSGSLLLVVLGQYEHMVTALSTFVDGLVTLLTGGTPVGMTGATVTVVSFVAGAFVGLFTVAHLVRRALRTYREATMAFLVALVVGALRAPVVEVSAAAPWTVERVTLFAVAAAVGAVLVAVLERSAVVSVDA